MSVEEKSTSELLRDLSDEMTKLVHQEVDLAKVELSEKGRRLGTGAGLFGGAAAVGYLGGGALVAAAIAGISTAVTVWLAALIVGLALAGVAGIMALSGRAQMARGAPPIPEAAIDSSKEDIEWLKTQAKSARR
jgi:MFS family permease